MRAATALTVGLATLAAVVPAAGASRTPTAVERESLAAYADQPARCLKLRVSTESSRYASLTFNAARYTSCQQYASNGITIVRRIDGRWRKRYAGSDCTKPSTKRVPTPVWRDLIRGFCG